MFLLFQSTDLAKFELEVILERDPDYAEARELLERL